MMVNTAKSQHGTQENTQSELKTNSAGLTVEAKRGLYKMTSFYGASYMFWVTLWWNNDGPGGVEIDHLVLFGLGHLVMVAIHAYQAFQLSAASENDKGEI
ncbi:MAG: hypothetical protein MJK04_04800 [Psychrosphaera sp.]|nr:hypothetical protein [Psychrosphaera sp.]